MLQNNWAVTCDFQQCGILTSIDSDEPVQPPLKPRNSKWCSVSSLTLIKYSSDKQRLWSGWSESLLVARTKWLEISCTGSINICYGFFSLFYRLSNLISLLVCYNNSYYHSDIKYDVHVHKHSLPRHTTGNNCTQYKTPRSKIVEVFAFQIMQTNFKYFWPWPSTSMSYQKSETFVFNHIRIHTLPLCRMWTPSSITLQAIKRILSMPFLHLWLYLKPLFMLLWFTP